MPAAQPYLHQSRHNHAARRVRGPGGRFLTADEVRALQASGELSGNSNSASLSAQDKPGDSQGQAESTAHPQQHGHMRTLSEAGNLVRACQQDTSMKTPPGARTGLWVRGPALWQSITWRLLVACVA